MKTEGLLALVVGAGKVGLRKAEVWRNAGGEVRFVDPRTDIEVDDELIREPFAAQHLEDVSIVFACATDAVNSLVVETSHANGILVCDAIRPERGDFTLPAVVRRGDLTVAVSTNGAAPALAKRLRDRLEAEFDEAYTIWTRILGNVRTAVLKATENPETRRDLFHALTDSTWLERLRQIGPEATEAEMLQFVASADGP
jgi:precorrin-2 dehydrogenase/sirohydrochlorin ferrochelatase